MAAPFGWSLVPGPGRRLPVDVGKKWALLHRNLPPRPTAIPLCRSSTAQVGELLSLLCRHSALLHRHHPPTKPSTSPPPPALHPPSPPLEHLPPPQKAKVLRRRNSATIRRRNPLLCYCLMRALPAHCIPPYFLHTSPAISSINFFFFWLNFFPSVWANFHSSKFPCICVTVSHGLPGMVARVSHRKPKCLHRRERVPCSAAWHASNPILPRISFNGNQMPYMFPIPSFLQLLVQHSHLQATPFHMPPSTLLKTLTKRFPRVHHWEVQTKQEKKNHSQEN